ncbi:MAG: YdcF family protein [Lachnospiraceae bacterium]|nr:YdcF family protein [Lachnospiraceae bacterium]
MSKKTLLAIGVTLAVISVAVILIMGRTWTFEVTPPEGVKDTEAYEAVLEQETEAVRVTDVSARNGKLYVTVGSVSRGKAFLEVRENGENIFLDQIYSHAFGILTVNTFFGRTRGAVVLPIAVVLFLAALFIYRYKKLRDGLHKNLYQYRNINNLGWVIFLGAVILSQIIYSLTFFSGGLDESIERLLYAASAVSMFVLPIAFIIFLAVSVSNMRLMQKEGKRVRNMLGVILGLFVCLATLFPLVLEEIFQRSPSIDMHNEKNILIYVLTGVRTAVLSSVFYLECILASAIALTVKAAKRIPAFDKDYMLVLGAKFRKDGTLTPLLKGRVDKALEFAKMQEEATGKKLFLVPSGGQGPDEVMPEAHAMRNYILSTGFPEDRVLPEDRSKNTAENMKFSRALIEKHSDLDDPKIGFSTTNYHVFRSGILATHAGMQTEGIGSGTRSYFWINAFIREFIATVNTGWKKHLNVVLVLTALSFLSAAILYLSVRL